MQHNSKIVLNTSVMYIRLGITMLISLITSRWVLLALGEEDFGIYNLVAGLLALLMFLNMSLAATTQRFLSYALGANNISELKETFYYSCVVHLVVGCALVVLIESIGSLLLMYVLSVPDGKLGLAFFCLHCLTISTFFTIISVPYNAALLSHENIVYVVFVNIVFVVLRLFGAAYLLSYAGSRLRLYAVIMAAIHIINTILYRAYCKRHYEETRWNFHKISDSRLLNDYIHFAGWNIIGSFSSLIRTQGIALLLNSFYGVIINASYGIATQVKGQLANFSSAITTATRPQIVKSERANNRNRSLALSYITCKSTFLLLATFAVPLLIEMPYILSIWLKNVPTYAVNFTRIIIVISLFFQFTFGVSLPLEAVGKIKWVQILTSILHCSTIPIGYVMIRLGATPTVVMLMTLLEEILSLSVWIYYSHRETGMSIGYFVGQVLSPSLLTVIGAFIIASVPHLFIEQSWLSLLTVIIISFTLIPIIGYFYVLSKFEREKINTVIVRFLTKIKK